jgi:hypothetical protein
MRIIRVIHAASVSLALSLPMIALGGGCDGGGGGAPPAAKETPEDAAARGKTIQDAYKANPPDSAKKAAAAGK